MARACPEAPITPPEPSLDPALTALEDERARISRELHDALGQLLAAVKIRLTTLASQERAAALKDELREIVSLVDHSLAEVSALARRLRPPALDEQGLGGALEDLIDSFRKTTGIPTDFVVSGHEDDQLLPVAAQVGLYRITQEALSNVARHSQASRAAVVIWYAPDETRLVISDDGCGFDIEKARGMGLKSIRDRAGQLGGDARISTSAEGTRLTIVIPTTDLPESAPA